MTKEQAYLVKQAQILQDEIKKLNDIINTLQLEYIDISNQLFDSIGNEKKKVRKNER